MNPICPNCGVILPYIRGLTCAKCHAPLHKEPVAVVVEETATRIPWLTLVTLFVVIGVFFDLMVRPGKDLLEPLSRWGYAPGADVWRGHVWGLFTSSFLHEEPIHLCLNVYWLWVLGSRLEQAIGSLRWLALLLASSLVSSACELAGSGEMGIGFSGVAYAFFGFMWVAWTRFPRFDEVLTRNTIVLFIAWLFVCIWLTVQGILNVGNFAHFAGLIFGATVGAMYLRPIRWVAVAGVVLWMSLAVLVLFWCPWSLPWLRVKAYSAHTAGEYVKALDYYSRIIQRELLDTWAYANRSLVFMALERWDEAKEDEAKSGGLILDPKKEKDD